MLKSESPNSKRLTFRLILSGRNTGVAAPCLLALILAAASPAAAQSFTLTAGPFNPDAMAPGGTTSSTITVGSVNGFSGQVDLSCQVTPTTLTDTPACTVSPATVTPNASASATITTKTDTSNVAYSITITGTASSIGQTTTTPAQTVTVLAVTPQFTVTVTRAVSPTSIPAGSGSQGQITVTPINGYQSPGYPQKGVTLACATITPLVTIPPVCSFTYPTGITSLPVSGTAATTTITINTFGPVVTGSNAAPRKFYAMWLPLPMLMFVGLGAAVGGKRSRKAWALLGIFIISGGIFLMPACGSNTTTTTTPNGTTPSNTYNFTIVGVDADGNVSSNTGSTTNTNPTVTLTVTAPPAN